MFLLEGVRMAILGLGYVGLPLAVEFSKRYKVIGFDIDIQRISELTHGYDCNNEIASCDIDECLNRYKNSDLGLLLTCDSRYLDNIDVYIVTVPTPVDINKRPDLSILYKATEYVGTYLKQGGVVIYESTVYPGCTEDECVPILEKTSNLQFNIDFFVGYSPERVNPGDRERLLRDIKKVTSGSTEECATFVDELYSSIISGGTYKAPSIKVAEAAKAIENAQRDINISFMNEVALILDRMDIDTYDVLNAAGTKWNFLNFKPGLVGGHCIGVDPYYLAFQAKRLGVNPNVITSGRSVNEEMGKFIARKVKRIVDSNGLIPERSKVLILGFTFKENCSDVRNTGVAILYENILKYALSVDVYDPIANKQEVIDKYGISLIESFDDDCNYDVVVYAVDHDIFKCIKWEVIRKQGVVIFDIKGVLDKSLVRGRL